MGNYQSNSIDKDNTDTNNNNNTNTNTNTNTNLREFSVNYRHHFPVRGSRLFLR